MKLKIHVSVPPWLAVEELVKRPDGDIVSAEDWDDSFLAEDADTDWLWPAWADRVEWRLVRIADVEMPNGAGVQDIGTIRITPPSGMIVEVARHFAGVEQSREKIGPDNGATLTLDLSTTYVLRLHTLSGAPAQSTGPTDDLIYRILMSNGEAITDALGRLDQATEEQAQLDAAHAAARAVQECMYDLGAESEMVQWLARGLFDYRSGHQPVPQSPGAIAYAVAQVLMLIASGAFGDERAFIEELVGSKIGGDA